ncbi:unnamed protein product [Porites lobata]|uniref:SAP domain-containing protein n=1 Tax=Porites lobata TaxID=104759 RepID=A0ABN8R464_9CNID|nr:unnamed protein product [Porites lobata]
MPRQRRNINRRNAVLDGANVPAEPTDYSAMSTKALRLMLGERHLQQTGNRRELISRLQHNEQQRPPASQSAGAQPNSSIATGVPHAELAALIASIVDERMNRQLIQDGGASSAQLTRPSPPSNLQDSLRSSPPPPPQDGGQNTTQQQPSFQNPPTGNLLPSTAVSSGLAASSGLVDFSDPAQVASLHPNFRQPSLASHLTKATSTAITNGEYVDFATLLPMTSLLTDSIHSHLNLKVGDQGLTIPLPSSSKRPKITSIDRWLDAFAIYFAVIVSVYPSRAADLIAYQQLIRDAARKFPGMAWYVYDVEFRRRASHNLSAKWGERDVQLYLDTFTGLPKSGCRSCGSTDHLSDTCPLSPRRSRDALTQSDLCYNFNKGRPCARTPCPYQHRCNQPGCSAAHSGEDHTKLTRHREDRPKSSSSSGNSSRGHS